MGAVYLCSDERLPDVHWALKELHHTPHEAQVLARLEHDRLPLVVDFFSENGRFYLVREYVPGINLAEKVERDGPVSEAVAITWGIQIADVLDFLHGQKPPIFYRDLKPQNIVLSPGGLKLIDFGLAGDKAQGPARGEATGSLSYSAPEQLDDPSSAGEASDIYGLGAVLYFLLLGRPPSPVAGDRHRLLPSRPDLLPETEELILRCLESDPRRRFSSASELMVALQFLQGRYPRLSGEVPVEVDEEPAMVPAVAPVRRGRRLRRALSAVVLGGLFLGLGAFIVHSLPTMSGTVQLESWTPPINPVWAQSQRQGGAVNHEDAESMLRLHPDSGLARVLRFNADAPKDRRHIPVLLPLSGEYSEFGEWMARGIALYLEDAGPDKAPYIELYDTGLGGQDTLGAVQALAKRPEICAMLGPMTSQVALFVAPLCNTEHISMIALGASDPRITSAGPYTFAFSPPQDKRYEKLADALVSKKCKRILIAQPDSASLFYSVADAFEEELKKLPAASRPQASRIVYPSDLHVRSGFAEGLMARGFDGVFITDNRPGAAARVVRMLRRNGFKGPICAMVHVGSREFLREGKDLVEGVVLVNFMLPERLPKVAALQVRYREIYKEEPSSITSLAYLGLTCIEKSWSDGHREQTQAHLLEECIPEKAVGPDLDTAQAYRVESGKYVLLSGGS